MFDWPVGIQDKTKVLISQILWTLWLDFEGVIEGTDAPRDLIEAMGSHGVDVSDDMRIRMVLPHLDGGKYGKHLTRIVIGRQTRQIRLVSTELPPDLLPDASSRSSVGDSNSQLFGDLVPCPRDARAVGRTPEKASDNRRNQSARGDARDCLKTDSARGDARDWQNSGRNMSARGPTRDDGERRVSARGPTRDDDENGLSTGTALPARGQARDDEIVIPARGDSRDKQPLPAEPALARETARDSPGNPPDSERGDTRDELLLPRDARDEPGSRVPARGVSRDKQEASPGFARLMAELEDGLDDSMVVGVRAPAVGRSELVSQILDLVGQLETETSPSPAPDMAIIDELLAEKHELVERVARLMRRVKDAEARLLERNREVAGLRVQVEVAEARCQRLELNLKAFQDGELIPGRHVRAASRVLAEVPDAPGAGRNRTTGSKSTLAYSVG